MHPYTTHLKSIALSLLLASGLASQAGIFTVTTTADSGPGSLRQAILDANGSPGVDSIVFDISTAPYLIQPLSPLPAITDPVVIDGATQPGFSGSPLVELDGSGIDLSLFATTADGLNLMTSDCIVRALVIGGFHRSGILIQNSEGTFTKTWGGNKILGCYIGLRPDGVTANGNGVHTDPEWFDPAGILILNTDGNEVGDGTASGRNIISGNKWGVHIVGDRMANDTIVDGNYIGTDASGAVAVPNCGGNRPLEWDLEGWWYPTAAGVYVSNSHGNAIRNNLLSGNRNSVPTTDPTWVHQQGCGVWAEGGDGLILRDNKIGTDASGTRRIPNQMGVRTIAEGCIFERNLVSANLTMGIRLEGGNHLIQDNYIGTDITGTIALGNGDTGLGMTGSWTADSQVRRNVVSANAAYGISVNGERNVFEGNFIGTDKDGTKALLASDENGNPVRQWAGLWLDGNWDSDGDGDLDGGHHVCGGTSVGARNVIAGNTVNLVVASQANRIVGNYIGTDATGTRALGSDLGISTYSDAGHLVANNVIGGTESGEGNLISGNLNTGLALGGVTTYSNRVEGNLIGTDVTRLQPLPNGFGVGVGYSSHDNVIGGKEPGMGNVIAYNGAGITVSWYDWEDDWGPAPYPVNNCILGNSIHDNGWPDALPGFGIWFPMTGHEWDIIANDNGDGDEGPNGLQNYPVITSAATTPASTLVQGSLNSTPSTTFRIEFFSNPACDPSGYGEGETFLGFSDQTTDDQGNVSFSVTLPAPVTIGSIITATATDPNGNTSPFSSCASEPPVVQGDTTPPIITTPGNLSVEATSPAGAVVTFTVTAQDDVSGPGSVICVPSSGSVFSLGTTTVTATATDAAGNAANATFTVTVVDTTAPEIQSPADIYVACSVDALLPVTFSATAADTVDLSPTVIYTPASGSGFPAGTTVVTCTATDASGNSATCTFRVIRAALGFAGFLPPIGGADATGGSFVNPVRTFKAGSTIPVKFTAACGGSPVLTGTHRLQVIKFTDATTSDDPIDATPQGAATTGNQFRLTDDQWQFNLDTKATGMTKGIWQLSATLSDGSQHAVWIQLK